MKDLDEDQRCVLCGMLGLHACDVADAMQARVERRRQYACAAIVGFCSSDLAPRREMAARYGDPSIVWRELAADAFALADAMLEEEECER